MDFRLGIVATVAAKLRKQARVFSNRGLSLALSIALSTGVAGAQTSSAPTRGTVVEGRTTISLPDTAQYSAAERELVRLERRRSAAIAAHDTSWLATLYAVDFRGVAANGRRVDRAILFGFFTADDPSSQFLIDELEIRELTPTTATVTGRLRTLARDGSVQNASRYLHVYVRRDGHWRIVAAEGSNVPL